MQIAPYTQGDDLLCATRADGRRLILDIRSLAEVLASA